MDFPAFLIAIHTVFPLFVDVVVKDRINTFRANCSTGFREVLNRPLPFKIPIMTRKYVKEFPEVFELGRSAEYKSCVDAFLDHNLLS